MIARIRKSMDEKDQGFTLIELLVVMIIIGILAAIAIPIFMNQRRKAVDAAAVSDVSTIGKEIATYYVDAAASAAVVAGIDTGRYEVGADAATAVDVGAVSNAFSAVPTVAVAASPTSTTWCVSLTYAGGTNTVVSYSAQSGLNNDGGC